MATDLTTTAGIRTRVAQRAAAYGESSIWSDLLDLKPLPPSVQTCAAPLLQGARFPATRYGKRAVMSYVVTR